MYEIVLTNFRSRHERRERERLRGAYSEIKRLSIEQQKSVQIADWDSPEALDRVTLDQIKQLQTELNQRIMELEKEL